MITLRCKADVKALAKAIKAAVGTGVPAMRRIVTEGDRACGWMSPDEYLLVMPYAAVPGALEAITRPWAGASSGGRRVGCAGRVPGRGARADQVLAKLSPVDFATLARGRIAPDAAAQVAAAFWKEGDGFTSSASGRWGAMCSICWR
jgi:sarcosine oxidase, subunit gamma